MTPPEPNSTHGRLTVIASGILPAYGTKAMHSLCQCSCGKKCKVSTRHMLNGHVQSCGCLRIERCREKMNKINQEGRNVHTAADKMKRTMKEEGAL